MRCRQCNAPLAAAFPGVHEKCAVCGADNLVSARKGLPGTEHDGTPYREPEPHSPDPPDPDATPRQPTPPDADLPELTEHQLTWLVDQLRDGLRRAARARYWGGLAFVLGVRLCFGVVWGYDADLAYPALVAACLAILLLAWYYGKHELYSAVGLIKDTPEQVVSVRLYHAAVAVGSAERIEIRTARKRITMRGSVLLFLHLQRRCRHATCTDETAGG